MKNIIVLLALAGMTLQPRLLAVSLDDLQFWTGSGTNRAALVIEWRAPEDFAGTTVPAPIANKSLVWGYRFNGSATGLDMLHSIAAADPRFYLIEKHYAFGTSIWGIGYHLSGSLSGVSDGVTTNFFQNGLLTNATVDVDAAFPLNPADLFWSGFFSGPNWESWTESGATGGFFTCPDRGTNTYWTSTDPAYASTGFHGQWDLSGFGPDGLILTNGSWFGFSVAAATYDFDVSAPYNAHKRAPATPDPAITALVKNFAGSPSSGHWTGQFQSVTNWNYSLERSADLKTWTPVVSAPGNNGTLTLTDSAPPTSGGFYRVRASQP